MRNRLFQKAGRIFFRNFVKWFLFLALFVFMGIYYFSNLKTHRFHVDEHEFIRKSYYFDLFFIKRDFQDPRWYIEDSPDQPKVGPYIYGFALHLAGVKDVEGFFQEIGFNSHKVGEKDWWWAWWWRKLENVPQEMLPILEPVWMGRIISVLFSLGALIALFGFSLRIKGYIFAWLTTFLLGTNYLMFTYGRNAMTDSMQLFFFFANLLLALYYIESFKRRSFKKAALLCLGLGASCALAVGVKVSGILMFLFLILFFVVLLFLHRPSKGLTTRLILSLSIFALSFFIVFVALHPYLYSNPIIKFISMFLNRLEAASDYRLIYPGSAVYSRLKAIELITKRTLLPGGVLYKFQNGKDSVGFDLIPRWLWTYG